MANGATVFFNINGQFLTNLWHKNDGAALFTFQPTFSVTHPDWGLEQQWQVIPWTQGAIDGSPFQISSLHSFLVADTNPRDGAIGNLVVQSKALNIDNTLDPIAKIPRWKFQWWDRIRVPAAKQQQNIFKFQLKNRGTGKCLAADPPYAGANNPSSVRQVDDNNGDVSQVWGIWNFDKPSWES